MAATALSEAQAKAKVLELLSDRWWRLSNLYWIRDEQGRAVRFVPNEPQCELWNELHYLNVILKARQLGFCYDPSMRVLTADFRWVPIGTVKPGQELVSVDEDIPGGRGCGRKMRRAVVEGVREVYEDAFRIVMDNGVALIATGPHRHLCKRRGGTEAIWREVSETRVGDEIRYVTTPWTSADPTYEDGWFGGLLDGEGSMRAKDTGGFEITVAQRPGAVLDRARRYLTDRGYCFHEEIDARKAGETSKFGDTPVHKLVLHRMNQAFRLLGETRPERFVSDPWWEGRDLPGKRSGDAWAKVVSIEPLGKRRMIDLQTSTKTFICEGFVSHNSTFVAIFILDTCLFRSGTSAGIIDITIDDAKGKLAKIKFAFDHLPDEIKRNIPITKDNAFELEWGNGSKVSVGTSHRGGTLQILHVSEFGKIAAKHPDKSREIKTGAFGTVHKGSMIFVESTAEGAAGDYHDMVQTAQATKAASRPLSQQDFKLHFFPWWRHRGYVENPVNVVITTDMATYFAKLETDRGIVLTAEQKAWYASKARLIGPDDMYREYPSYPDEAFHAAIQGAYFATQMTKAREQGRIGKVALDPSRPVNTFWDIGVDDNTSIWFHQSHGRMHHFIGYYENSGEGVDHYVRKVREFAEDRGYTYGKHYGPHDLDNSQWVLPGAEAAVDVARRLGLQFIVVPRIPSKSSAIEAARTMIATSWFDEANCARGLACLDNYRKEWDEKRATFKSEPLHDWASHGADAFMTGACGFATPAAAAEAPRKAKLGTVA